MDHLRISDNEPSSVILSQTDAPNVPKQAEAKRDGLISELEKNPPKARLFNFF